MAEAKNTAAKTPEEKAAADAEKAAKERNDFIDKVVKEVTDHVKKTSDVTVVTDIVAQLATFGTTVMGTSPVATPTQEHVDEATKQSPIYAPVKGHISEYGLTEKKKAA